MTLKFAPGRIPHFASKIILKFLPVFNISKSPAKVIQILNCGAKQIKGFHRQLCFSFVLNSFQSNIIISFSSSDFQRPESVALLCSLNLFTSLRKALKNNTYLVIFVLFDLSVQTKLLLCPSYTNLLRIRESKSH